LLQRVSPIMAEGDIRALNEGSGFDPQRS
jgi:hypothetical protein